VRTVTEDRPPEIEMDELAGAVKYIEYLKHLESFAEAERELQGKDERELRAMVLQFLSTFKQQQFTAKRPPRTRQRSRRMGPVFAMDSRREAGRDGLTPRQVSVGLCR
jgi:hypothetical protein